LLWHTDGTHGKRVGGGKQKRKCGVTENPRHIEPNESAGVGTHLQAEVLSGWLDRQLRPKKKERELLGAHLAPGAEVERGGRSGRTSFANGTVEAQEKEIKLG